MLSLRRNGAGADASSSGTAALAPLSVPPIPRGSASHARAHRRGPSSVLSSSDLIAMAQAPVPAPREVGSLDARGGAGRSADGAVVGSLPLLVSGRLSAHPDNSGDALDTFAY
eukprot:356579-Chlamydomonas_euryale.AAC.6